MSTTISSETRQNEGDNDDGEQEEWNTEIRLFPFKKRRGSGRPLEPSIVTSRHRRDETHEVVSAPRGRGTRAVKKPRVSTTDSSARATKSMTSAPVRKPTESGFVEIAGQGLFYGSLASGVPEGKGMLWEKTTRRLWIGTWLKGKRSGWFQRYNAPSDLEFDLRKRVSRVNRIEGLLKGERVFFTEGGPAFVEFSNRNEILATRATCVSPPYGRTRIDSVPIPESSVSTRPYGTSWRTELYLGACGPPSRFASFGFGIRDPSEAPYWSRRPAYFEASYESGAKGTSAPTVRFSMTRSRGDGDEGRPLEIFFRKDSFCYVGTFDDRGASYRNGTLLRLLDTREPETFQIYQPSIPVERTPRLLPQGKSWWEQKFREGRIFGQRRHGTGNVDATELDAAHGKAEANGQSSKEKELVDSEAKKGVTAVRCLFQGFYFRSLLEARWMLFLKVLLRDSAIFYEPYTTVVPDTGQSYTPDFLVVRNLGSQIQHASSTATPQGHDEAISVALERSGARGSGSDLRDLVFHPNFRVFWLEIKPRIPDHPERWRMKSLVEATGIDGYIFYGQTMEERTDDPKVRSKSRYVDGIHGVEFPAGHPTETREPMRFTECLKCRRVEITLHGRDCDIDCGCVISEEDGFSPYFSNLCMAYRSIKGTRHVDHATK